MVSSAQLNSYAQWQKDTRLSRDGPTGAVYSGTGVQDVTKMIPDLDLYSVAVDGCACGMKGPNAENINKPWRFVTSSGRLVEALTPLR